MPEFGGVVILWRTGDHVGRVCGILDGTRINTDFTRMNIMARIRPWSVM